MPTTALQVRPDALTRIELGVSGAAKVVLEAGSDGWLVTEPVATRANQVAVQAMIGVFADVEIHRRVANEPAPAHGLGPRSRVDVVGAGADSGAARRFAVGAEAGEETYVQLDGDAYASGAFLTGAMSHGDAPTSRSAWPPRNSVKNSIGTSSPSTRS